MKRWALVSELGNDTKEYEILRRLAVGGMAEIYLARTTDARGFVRYLVIKKVKPEYVSDPHFVGMFLDEARLAARLEHINIARVFDIGQLEGAHFFSMEYLHGEDCWELFKKFTGRGVPLRHALTIITKAAAGLHYAHNKITEAGKPLGIIHRDVTPTNIVVTFDGEVKLVDFGVARAAERQVKSQTGILKGKLSYMAPEQLIGSAYDHRADVYACGKVLYELSTGFRLFAQQSAESDFQLMSRIVSGKFAAPTKLVKGYPPELEIIVLRALAGEPEQRYQSAADLRDELVRFADAAGYKLSGSSLGRFMVETFGRRPEPWADDSGFAKTSTVTVALTSLAEASDLTQTGTHTGTVTGTNTTTRTGLFSDEWAVVSGTLDSVDWTKTSGLDVDTAKRSLEESLSSTTGKKQAVQTAAPAGSAVNLAATSSVPSAPRLEVSGGPFSRGNDRRQRLEITIIVVGLLVIMAIGLWLGMTIGGD